MTCIVGYVANGRVFIGGDSAGVAGIDVCVRSDAKVFFNGPFLFGFTSSFRMGQILRYKTVLPECPHWDVERFMATDFIDAVKKGFKDGGYGDEKRGGTFLVGYKGRLWRVDGDYQVGWTPVPYQACGCGESYSLGSMHALCALDPNDERYSPEKKVKQALDAAVEFSGGVRPPYTILST